MSKHHSAQASLIPAVEDRLLTPAQAAERLGIRTETLKNYRKRTSPTTGPKFIRLNDRMVRYRLSDLVAFVAQREAEHCGGEGPLMKDAQPCKPTAISPRS